MSLTPEQKALWDRRPPVTPSGDQTRAQAENLAVAGFTYACSLEGIPLPAEADIREAIRAKG